MAFQGFPDAASEGGPQFGAPLLPAVAKSPGLAPAPAQQAQPSAERSPSERTVCEIFTSWVVDSELVTGLLEAIGGDEGTLVDDFVAIPDTDLQIALGNLNVGGEAASALQKGKVVRVITRLLDFTGMPPIGLGSQMPAVPGTAAPGCGAGDKPASAGGEKRPLQDVLDQGEQVAFDLLSTDELGESRARYARVTGGPPP